LGVLMLNGRHQPEEVALKEGDVLSLFPKVGGG
jgi:molybdopterin converting factor small subunit